MLSDIFICDEEIKKQIKWKKIYGKTRNRVVYEGYTLNNKPCGEGTSYYSNGKKHLEGKFYIKGFIEGKEYYRNGQIRFEGRCSVCTSYGPNYPKEGNFYDMNGKLLFSGEFKVIKRGNLGFPHIEIPANFVGIHREDTDLEYLMWHDIKKAREKPEKILSYDESKYPMTYEEFKEQLLKIFIEQDWTYDRKFSREDKKEFVDCHEFDFHDHYNKECEKYDSNKTNFFEKNDEYEIPIKKLLFDCDIYHITKELSGTSHELKKVAESSYPLNYQEFKEKMIGLLIKKTQHYKIPKKEVLSDLKREFNDDPDCLLHYYRSQCEDYDKAISQKRSIEASYVFCDSRLSSGPIYQWGVWLDYWLIG